MSKECSGLLPIGSVILLKEAKKRLMIYGIKQNSAEGKQYDYIGVLYPEGNLSQDYTYLFNHEDIESVFFLGFVDPEFTMYRKKLDEILNNVSE